MSLRKENPFYSISFNIILPVLILNKGQKFFSPLLPFELSSVHMLIIALAFPFFYGLIDLIRIKKINYVSLLGLIGVALTGGLALMQLEGFYFAVKEGAIPLIFAAAAGGSILFKKPFVKLMLFKSQLFDNELIQARLKENKTEKQFEKLMNSSTLILAFSFVVSAVLNFIIAIVIFKPPGSSLSDEAKRQLINEQVAEMTWMGWLFIALPLTFAAGFLLWLVLARLKKLTGLKLEELLPEMKNPSS